VSGEPPAFVEQRFGAFTISTDPRRVDVDAVHLYLARSYWAAGIPREIVARALSRSLCFGVYAGTAQVGFARVITDSATFAYLADVYVLEPYRGQGIARALMGVIRAHPDLQGLRRFLLATRDAHGLYARFGFAPPATPGSLMEIVDRDVYARITRPEAEPAPGSPS
jgi:ribosomal protein S18 acetylase RimI-like enzyme